MRNFKPIRLALKNFRKPAALALALAALPAGGQAAVTPKDVQVAARVLGFTVPPFAGTVKLGIVYDPANADSVADERSLLAILGDGLNIGQVRLVPVPLPLGKQASLQVDALFLTAGLGGNAALASALAAAPRKICITTDQAAALAGHCGVFVQTEPRVQITVNASALAASGVTFTTAFLLMVTEI